MEKLANSFQIKETVKAYEKLGHFLSVPGQALLQQSGILSPSSSSPESKVINEWKILDDGCGTGLITSLIKKDERLKNVEVVAADISQNMVDIVTKRIDEERWTNVNAQVSDAMDLKLESNSFSHTFANFCFMMLSDPTKAISEAIRVTKPGGVIGFTTHQIVGWFEPVKEAISHVPGNPPLLNPYELWSKTGLWHSTDYVSNLLISTPLSLQDVKVTTCKFGQKFENLEDFEKSLGPMILQGTTLWTEEQKKESTENLRKAIMDLMNERHGKNKPFEWEYIAVVATGRKPL